MKGFTKTMKRAPHMLTTKVGMSKKSNDPEFDDYQRHFSTLEGATDKLLKDTKAFTDAVNSLFTSGSGFATHFSNLFHPIAGEYDLIGKHPEAAHTVRNVDAYSSSLEELRTTVAPELELIESRIAGPVKELQGVLKIIRKTITKREHKLIDYDRFNNSLTKLRDKKEKSLNDEKNLFKLEQDFEVATNEYEYINGALKTDLPRFMQLATQFIDPLFHSFFYMQLNIFYLLLDKLNGFAQDKYEVSSVSPDTIVTDYETRRGDVMAQIEDMGITKRIVSTSKLVAQNRTGGIVGLGRSPSSTTTSTTNSSLSPASRAPPPMRSPSSSTFPPKTAPPPPPFASVASPPPYSPSANGGAAAAAAAKRAPPPPPPLKPKPKPDIQYVVALYDFAAQAEGDLSFNTGDRIEVIERGASAEDWWTGRLNGQQGSFPGNYVQET